MTTRRGKGARGRRPWAAPLVLGVLAYLLLLSGGPGGWPAGAQQAPEGEDVVQGGVTVGRFYPLAGEGSTLGYEVREPFLSPFLDLGGPGVAGFPVSAPFLERDGCAYQAFQVLLLQSCPGSPVRPANTFEILEE